MKVLLRETDNWINSTFESGCSGELFLYSSNGYLINLRTFKKAKYPKKIFLEKTDRWDEIT